MRDPSGQQRPDRPGGPQQSPPTLRSKIPSWILWVVMGGIAFYYIYVLFWPHQTARLNISYSGLVEQVQADRVKDVTLEGQSVSGSFKQEMQQVNGQLLPADQPAPPADAGSKVSKGTKFDTVMPENTNPI